MSVIHEYSALAPLGGGAAIALYALASAVRVYRERTRLVIEAIRRAEPSRQAALVGDEIDKLGITAKKLPPDRQYRAVMEVLEQRRLRMTLTFWLSVLVASLLSVIALASIFREDHGRTDNHLPLSSDQVWATLSKDLQVRFELRVPDASARKRILQELVRRQVAGRPASESESHSVADQIEQWLEIAAEADRAMHGAAMEDVNAARATGDYERARGLLRLRDQRRHHRDPETLYQLALMELLRFDVASARTYLQKARDLAPERALYSLVLGNLEERAGRRAEAREALQQAVERFRAVNDPAGAASADYALGRLETQAREFDAANRSLTSALRYYEGSANKHGQADVWRAVGHLERQMHHEELARTAYQHALKLLDGADDNKGRANILRGLGHLDRQRRDYSSAKRHYTAALAEFKKLGDPLGVANVSLALARLEKELGDPKRASGYLDTARERYEVVHSARGLADVAACEAQLAVLDGDPAAEGRLLAARATYEKSGLAVGQANMLRALGDLHFMQKRYEDALQQYRRALEVSSKSKLGQADALAGIGKVQRQLGQLEEARTSFSKAAELYRDLRDSAGMAAAESALATL